jgi:hypothetical protein
MHCPGAFQNVIHFMGSDKRMEIRSFSGFKVCMGQTEPATHRTGKMRRM